MICFSFSNSLLLNESLEVTEFRTQCIVFQCDDLKEDVKEDDLSWTQLGETWSDVAIFKLESETLGGCDSYRLLAWSSAEEGRQVLLNCNLNELIEWDRAEEDFCNFEDEAGNGYGFFCISPEHAFEMTQYIHHIKKVTSVDTPVRRQVLSVSVSGGKISRKLSTEVVVLRNNRESLGRGSRRILNKNVDESIIIAEEEEVAPLPVLPPPVVQIRPKSTIIIEAPPEIKKSGPAPPPPLPNKSKPTPPPKKNSGTWTAGEIEVNKLALNETEKRKSASNITSNKTPSDPKSGLVDADVNHKPHPPPTPPPHVPHPPTKSIETEVIHKPHPPKASPTSSSTPVPHPPSSSPPITPPPVTSTNKPSPPPVSTNKPSPPPYNPPSKSPPPSVPTPPLSSSSVPKPPSPGKKMSTRDMDVVRVAAPPRPPPTTSKDLAHVSKPKLVHVNHIEFDNYNARYKGVPDEWKDAFNKQFGTALETVPKVKLPQYESGIPAMLLMLERILFEKHGDDQVGIFRLAPDKDDCNFVKKCLNDGTFEMKDEDVNIFANLIKVFLRELPVNLLNVVDEETLVNAADQDSTTAGLIISEFPEPSKSCLLWLMDMCAKVVKKESVNKMGVRNLAIVISPNLFFMRDTNPMHALQVSQKISQLVALLIEWRMGMML